VAIEAAAKNTAALTSFFPKVPKLSEPGTSTSSSDHQSKVLHCYD